MAMGKNKTGIMAAITAAAEGSRTLDGNRARAQRSLPKGTIGSVRAGLGGIQDIATSLILPWGPTDRLDLELTAVNSDTVPASIADLVKSISNTEQQVPVLLRPSKEQDGYFEVIYGRRRILACKQLGIPVKALIRTLDDTEALMAKGLENANRRDLSFYERARFASAILAQGYERAEACQALSISKNTLSQLEKVSRLVPEVVGDGIGAAPDSGRPKWNAIAKAFETGALKEAKALKILSDCPTDTNSDGRLNLLVRASSVIELQKIEPDERTPVSGVLIKTVKNKLTVTIDRKGDAADFANWLDQNMDSWIKNSFEQYRTEKSKDGRSEQN